MNEEQKPHTGNDVEEHKMTAAIGYIPLLFFVPLFLTESKFAHFHGKQGLAITLGFVVIWVVMMILMPILGYFGYVLFRLAGLALLCLAVAGGYKASQGEEWELPVLGNIAKGFKF